MIKLAIHLHTIYSNDSNITIRLLIDNCKKLGITNLAITEHNNLDSYLKHQKEIESSGIKLIPGEEIRTDKGEIIGLFLKKPIIHKINGKYITLKDCIDEIKKQDGLILIPHPFDKMRLGIGEKNILENFDNIDIIEVFNSRTKLNYFNKQALKFAQKHKMIMSVGPDAHIEDELGNAIITMKDFNSKEEFLKNLKSATFETKRLKLKNIIRPTMNKIMRRIFKPLA